MTAAQVASPMFANLADHGWIKESADSAKHWAEQGKNGKAVTVCGTKLPPQIFDVLGQEPYGRNNHLGACRKCVDALVRRRYDIALKVGDRVVNREMGMTIYGVIKGFFEDDEGQPCVNLTRFWIRPPKDEEEKQDRKHGNKYWFRLAHKCVPYEERKTMTQADKSAPKNPSKTKSAPAEPAPDFKALAEQTRAKLQNFGKDKAAPKARKPPAKADALAHQPEDVKSPQLPRFAHVNFNIATQRTEGMVCTLPLGSEVLFAVVTRALPSGKSCEVTYWRNDLLQQGKANTSSLVPLALSPSDYGLEVDDYVGLSPEEQPERFGVVHQLLEGGKQALVAFAQDTEQVEVDDLLIYGSSRMPRAYRLAGISPALAPAEPAPEATPVDTVSVPVLPLPAEAPEVAGEELGSDLPVTVGAWVRFNLLDAAEEGWYEGVVTRVIDPDGEYRIRVTEFGTSTPMLRDGQPWEVTAFAPEIEVLQPAELPATTPLLPAEAPAQPGTLPWNCLVPYADQPRKYFNQAELVKLAVDLKVNGQLAELLARPHPTRPGYYQIAMGERRWRAIGLLVQGKVEVGDGEDRQTLFVEPTHPVRVQVRELTDVEMLEIGLRENILRQELRPLETADGFAALARAGRTPAQIRQGTSYSLRDVTRLIQISQSLISELREPFNSGVLSLAQVEQLVLAGPQLQRALWQRHIQASPAQFTPRRIRELIEAEHFPLENARFPLTMYQGAVHEADLFGDLKPHFDDKRQALDLQLTHVQGMARAAVEERGLPFAEVYLDAQDWWWNPGEGLAYSVNSHTGALSEYPGIGVRKVARNTTEPVFRHESALEARHTAPAPSPAPAPPQAAPDPRPARQQEKTAPTPAPAPAQETAPPSPAIPADLEFDTSALYWGLMFNRALERRAVYASLLTVAQYIRDDVMPALSEFQGANLERVQAVAGRVQAVLGELVHQQPVKGRVLVVNREGFDSEEAYALTLIERLRQVPADDLQYLADCLNIREALHGLDLNRPLVERTGALTGLRLSHNFLSGCNFEQLQAIHREAGLGEPQEQSAFRLRRVLVDASEGLAAQGYVPSFLTSGGAQ